MCHRLTVSYATKERIKNLGPLKIVQTIVMLRIATLILIAFCVLTLISCASHTHTIGEGPAFDRTEVQRQWYILYGLVPINDIDTQVMADGKSNYEITTEVGIVDWLYMAVLSPATITCRTVIVIR